MVAVHEGEREGKGTAADIWGKEGGEVVGEVSDAVKVLGQSGRVVGSGGSRGWQRRRGAAFLHAESYEARYVGAIGKEELHPGLHHHLESPLRPAPQRAQDRWGGWILIGAEQVMLQQLLHREVKLIVDMKHSGQISHQLVLCEIQRI